MAIQGDITMLKRYMHGELPPDAPKKYQPFEYDVTEVSKSGSEHVQESLFNMADEKDY